MGGGAAAEAGPTLRFTSGVTGLSGGPAGGGPSRGRMTSTAGAFCTVGAPGPPGPAAGAPAGGRTVRVLFARSRTSGATGLSGGPAGGGPSGGRMTGTAGAFGEAGAPGPPGPVAGAPAGVCTVGASARSGTDGLGGMDGGGGGNAGHAANACGCPGGCWAADFDVMHTSICSAVFGAGGCGDGGPGDDAGCPGQLASAWLKSCGGVCGKSFSANSSSASHKPEAAWLACLPSGRAAWVHGLHGLPCLVAEASSETPCSSPGAGRLAGSSASWLAARQ